MESVIKMSTSFHEQTVMAAEDPFFFMICNRSVKKNLLIQPESADAIVVDPFHPWSPAASVNM